MTPDEFLAWEREQPERHHYVRGEVFAMAGGSLRHNHLAARMIMGIGPHLRGGPCDIQTSDCRLGVWNDHFVYADAVVLCRPIALRPGTTDVVVNPTVVIEIVSKSTESYDRGDKQAAYLALPSLRHFVLVSQRDRRIEVYTRQDDGSFRFDVRGAGGTVRLEAVGVEVAVDEIYEGAFDLPGDT